MAETLETIKKYIGPFSGAQMDQIFYEILNYTSERYAKGTANGQAVAAGTIGYQDNSYYYSRQALQSAQAAANAADRAEAAVPAGIDSAVLFTRAQTLTSAQQAQARANMAAGGSNRNLLDNPWFTVNQRDFTSGNVHTVYFVDRWRGVRADITVSNNIVSFAYDESQYGYGFINQRLGLNSAYLTGQAVTLSFMLSDGTIYSTTFTPSQSTARTATIGPLNVAIQWNATYGYYIELRNYSTTEVSLKAVKLELGTASTLANDAPPDDELELLKCKKHCRVLDAGNIAADMLMGRFNANGNIAIFTNIIGFGNTMRTRFTAADTTLTLQGSWIIYDLSKSTGVNYAVTSITINNGTKYPNLAVLFNGTATPYAPCLLRADGSNAKIIMSQDL